MARQNKRSKINCRGFVYIKVKKPQNALAKGTLDSIIKKNVLLVDLLVENMKYISKKTIESRVKQNNLSGYNGSFSQRSPMACIEPMLAEFCRHLNQMAKSINQIDFLALAHDIVEDTPTSVHIKEFQRKICGMKQIQKLGKKYFYNFMRQHKNIVHTTKIHKQCVNCLEWATYHNMEKMYNLIYAEMVQSGVAI
jgi:hypothetical protein